MLTHGNSIVRFHLSGAGLCALLAQAPAVFAAQPAVARPAAVRPATVARDTEVAPEPDREKPPSAFVSKLGVGFGIPYGVLGGGLELGHTYVTTTGGVGTTIFGGAGWSAGARVYFNRRAAKFRPFIAGVYGTTLVYDIVVIGGEDLNGTLLGPAFYAGLDHDVGKPGAFVFSYGVGYVPPPALPGEVTRILEETGTPSPDLGIPIKLLLGFSYDFTR